MSPQGEGGRLLPTKGLKMLELKYNQKNINKGKELRKTMTKEERKLWFEFLTNLPIKIYRQKLIGNFIVDFYCHKKKIAIEIDGSQHFFDDEKHKDELRTEYLNSLGITVLRYSNLDISKNFSSVCKDIYNKIFED